jgi:hypothetical protein
LKSSCGIPGSRGMLFERNDAVAALPVCILSRVVEDRLGQS